MIDEKEDCDECREPMCEQIIEDESYYRCLDCYPLTKTTLKGDCANHG